MRKRSLRQQLDDAIETLVAQQASAPSQTDAKLAELVRLAEALRQLPREDFRQQLKTSLERSVTMGAAKTVPQARKVKPIPEGHHTATPYLFIRGAAKAIEFYKKAFGATEFGRLEMPGGKIGHAEIKIGDSAIMLADEVPEMGYRSPQSLGGSSVSIHLYVEDVDAVAKQAVAAGAKVLRPVADQFYGDRSGNFQDPFGHFWSISTHVEDVSQEEMRKRAEAAMSQQAGSAARKQEAVKTVKAVREGFHTVTPYVTVRRAAELVEFVKQVFGATETFRGTGSAGGLHAEVKIGDSMLMMGGYEGMASEGPTELHIYVPNADATYQRALQAGATSIHPPADMDYGERSASVEDPFRNKWYIATWQGPHYVREGIRTVTPSLNVRGAAQWMDFLKDAMGAEELMRHKQPDGAIRYAEVRIGDSVIEIGEAHGPYQPMPTMLHLYVEDVDGWYQRAVRAGATSVQPPADQDYGDRTAWVKDAFGNSWYFATHIKDVAT